MSVGIEETIESIPSPYREPFDEFYAREVGPVVGLAFVLSGSRVGAEDLAQEGFLAAYRNWQRVGSMDDPGAWVRRVVANRAVSGFRRRNAELRAMLKLNRPMFELLELPSEGCLGCGGALRGRQVKWCSDRCRKRNLLDWLRGPRPQSSP